MLLAIFLPWAYFFVQKRPIAGVIHLVLWLASIPLLFIGIGFLIWLIQAGHASYDLRNQNMRDHATDIATKMAAQMAANQTTTETNAL